MITEMFQPYGSLYQSRECAYEYTVKMVLQHILSTDEDFFEDIYCSF
jgi:hypothetical protein